MFINQEFGAHCAPLESEKIYSFSSVGTIIESNKTWISWFRCESAFLEFLLFLYSAWATYPATYARGPSSCGVTDNSL